MPKQKESGVCPLVDRVVTAQECAAVNGKHPSEIPRGYKNKSDWREICKACPHRPKPETTTE